MAYRIMFFVQLATVLAAVIVLNFEDKYDFHSAALVFGMIAVGALLHDAWGFALERDRKYQREKAERTERLTS